VACKIDAVGIVDEAVENGVGVSRITDNVVPFVDRKLAGDDCRSSPRRRRTRGPGWLEASRIGLDVCGFVAAGGLGRPTRFLDWACGQLKHRSPLARNEVSN
jgi:hypothetical protein